MGVSPVLHRPGVLLMNVVFSTPASCLKAEQPHLYLLAGLSPVESFSYLRCAEISTFSLSQRSGAPGPLQFVVSWKGVVDEVVPHSDGPLTARIFSSVVEARSYVERYASYWLMTYGKALITSVS